MKYITLYLQMDEFLSDKANAEPAVSFTETLAAVSSAPGAMSQQDLYQSTVLMQAAAQARPGNASQAKAIITVNNDVNAFLIMIKKI